MSYESTAFCFLLLFDFGLPTAQVRPSVLSAVHFSEDDKNYFFSLVIGFKVKDHLKIIY